jgi:hypothetical protein
MPIEEFIEAKKSFDPFIFSVLSDFPVPFPFGNAMDVPTV